MMRVRLNSFRGRWIERFGAGPDKLKLGLQRGFTIAEMLVVIVIIGLLAALVLPNIRGHSESVAINAACRQFVDDLAFARQKAISQRSTVAVVFLSSNVFSMNLLSPLYNSNELAAIKRLQGGVYTHYALYQYRSVGEQPGSHDSAGYITEWKPLPEKTFFYQADISPNTLFQNNAKFPFPFSKSVNFDPPGLPYFAFDSEGRCIRVEREETGAGRPVRDIDVHLARGNIFFSRITSPNPKIDGSVDSTTYDVQQIPPGNATNNDVHIDFLTGRAKRIELQLK